MTVAITTKARHPFIGQWLERLPAEQPAGPAWLTDFRKAAKARLATLEVPTAKHEEWRFTKIKSLTEMTFASAPEADVAAADLVGLTYDVAERSTLVFVNGRFAPALSTVEGMPEGVVVTSLSQLAEAGGLDAVQDFLGTNTWYEQDLFATLNAAGFEDGTVILVPRNAVVEQPIHVLNVAAGDEEPYAVNVRNVIVAGQSSQFQVIEEYVSLGDGVYFHNVVNDVHVGANAQVDHVKVQRDGDEAFHVARNVINLAGDSRYKSVAVTLGARLSRNDSYALYEGENIDCTLDGLAYVRGKQLADTHTAIDHALPHSRSFQLHKCVVDDAAHTVFNGKIYVRQDAQQIASEQLNQNLILSTRGKVDTKPQLEILADDVVCTHGATVGQLEEEQLFYLVSRGLDPATAKNLLTYAFAAEVIEAIPLVPVRDRLEDFVLSMASGGEQ